MYWCSSVPATYWKSFMNVLHVLLLTSYTTHHSEMTELIPRLYWGTFVNLHVDMVTPYHSICNAMQLEVVIITMCWCWLLSCSVATRSLKLTHNQPSWVVNRGLGSHTYIWGLFPWSWELHGDGRFPVKKTVALSLSDTARLQSKDSGDIAYTILRCCYHKFP